MRIRTRWRCFRQTRILQRPAPPLTRGSNRLDVVVVGTIEKDFWDEFNMMSFCWSKETSETSMSPAS